MLGILAGPTSYPHLLEWDKAFVPVGPSPLPLCKAGWGRMPTSPQTLNFTSPPLPPPVSSAQEMSRVHPGLSNKGGNTAKCSNWTRWEAPCPPWPFPRGHRCISSHGPKSRPRAVRRASCQGNRSAEILAALSAQLFKTSLRSIHISPLHSYSTPQRTTRKLLSPSQA